MNVHKPSLAVFKFSSCDGCQLSLLNMEDELLSLADVVDIAFFLEATRTEKPGPYDIALVEGSITTPHEVDRIHEIREKTRTLIALGTCATSGGIQALRNFADAGVYAQTVYAHPEYLNYLKSATPISEHVQVDLELWGCPVNKSLVLEVLTAVLNNRRPILPTYPVCMECKRSSTICVLVDKGIPCLGPATQAGCGALCPTIGRGCYGCFGPYKDGNPQSLADRLQTIERQSGETLRLFRGISGYSQAFRKTADVLVSSTKEAK